MAEASALRVTAQLMLTGATLAELELAPSDSLLDLRQGLVKQAALKRLFRLNPKP